MFATILGVVWVILNRQFCILEPFRQLCAGKVSADRSIATTYAAIPAQLTVWRAIKARHYVLTLLCLTALLANLLGISLGTLFNENKTVVRYHQSFEPMVAPLFNNQSLFDFHRRHQGYVPTADTFLLFANLTSNTPISPWTSRDYFFQPHRLAQGTQATPGARYVVNTRGFGVRANCTPVNQLPAPHQENNTACPSAIDLAATELSAPASKHPFKEQCARELVIPSPLNDTGACEFDMAIGWARTTTYCPEMRIARSENASQHLPIAYTTLHCQPYFQSAMFDATVDAAGNVYSYNQTSQVSSDLSYSESNIHTRVLLRYGIGFPTPSEIDEPFGNGGWHMGTNAASWMSDLLAAFKGSRDFLDPKKPPPNAADLIPAVEEVYRRGFAIFLGQHLELFDKAHAGQVVEGKLLATETRIFVDETSLIISLVVMSINMVVAIVIYARPSVRLLPRMPTCIASIVAYVAPSRIVANSSEALDKKNPLSFGQYKGLDGKPHTGIELDAHVTLIKSSQDDGVMRGILGKLPGLMRRRKYRRQANKDTQESQDPQDP
ncbi:hypothetical protein CDD81_1774 [Ophiocordyceps australis]|uniref:Uncharacterized protein n=1 Tax=Ophiocordyceps australis TaxID=1399860 RepID=A0A2C5XKG2_9HYPO|nr:hypothetical protein CDD81_1774 [Ophiocordyceps australis]